MGSYRFKEAADRRDTVRESALELFGEKGYAATSVDEVVRHEYNGLLADRNDPRALADAIEQLYGKQSYMTHDMRALFKTKFAGPAVTVLMKKEEHKEVFIYAGD